MTKAILYFKEEILKTIVVVLIFILATIYVIMGSKSYTTTPVQKVPSGSVQH